MIEITGQNDDTSNIVALEVGTIVVGVLVGTVVGASLGDVVGE